MSSSSSLDALIRVRLGVPVFVLWHLFNWALLGACWGIFYPAITSITLPTRTISAIDMWIAQPMTTDTVPYATLVAIVLIVPLAIYVWYALVGGFFRTGAAAGGGDAHDQQHPHPWLMHCLPLASLASSSSSRTSSSSSSSSRTSSSSSSSSSRTRTARLALLLELIFGHLVTLSLTILLTELIKLYAHRPRPDFLARCGTPLPNNAATQAPFLFSSADCPNVGSKDFSDGLKSFFSGHTSTAFCAATYFSLFLYHAMLTRQLQFGGGGTPSQGQFNQQQQQQGGAADAVVPAGVRSDELAAHDDERGASSADVVRAPQSLRFIAVLAPPCFAAFVSGSRLWDNRHHVIDVICGMIVGIVCAWIVWNLQWPKLRQIVTGGAAGSAAGAGAGAAGAGAVAASSKQPPPLPQYDQLQHHHSSTSATTHIRVVAASSPAP